MTRIPDWLVEKNPGAPTGRPGGMRFVERTASHVVSFAGDAVFNEKVSLRRGVLQAVEPRFKILGLLALIVALSFEKSITGMAAYSALCATLALLSRIPALMLLKRLLPAAILTLIIALPSSLNVIVDGNAVITLYRFRSAFDIGPVRVPALITVTDAGLLTVLGLILRVGTSAFLVFLGMMTTMPNAFVRAASGLLPGAMRGIMSVSYRYMFLLVRRLGEYVMAYRSRPLPRDTGRGWASSGAGSLFHMSMRLGEDLRLAMESRGVERFPTVGRRPGRVELGWAAFVVLFIALLNIV